MAAKRSPYRRRDPNIVVEASPSRSRNGRRPARPAGPPWIIIGAIALAVILLIIPFLGMLNNKPKNDNANASTATGPAEDIFRHKPEDERPWGPLRVGMTKQQVLDLQLGRLFDSAREGDRAAQTYKNKETWIYTIHGGSGGIFHEGGGAKLWIIFKNPEGTVQYMKHPLRAVVNKETGKLENKLITYEELVRLRREMADR